MLHKRNLFLLLSLLGVLGCDTILDPSELKVAGNDSVVYERKVLLEDYTGHRCPNCPAAAAIINEQLVPRYGERLIVLSVHVTPFFAGPGAAPFTNDYRTPAGTTFDDIFNISGAGLPAGMVNRRHYTTSAQRLAPNAWGDSIQALLSVPADAGIEIKNEYDTNLNQLVTKVKTIFLRPLSGTYMLGVYYVEDSIQSAQLSVGNQEVHDYIHRHVLRGSLNSTWGERIAKGNISTGDSVLRTYTGLSLGSGWKARHCSVLAFVYDSLSYEVLQAEEAKIIP